MDEERLLTLDVASRVTGWAITHAISKSPWVHIESFGVIRIRQDLTVPSRIDVLVDEVAFMVHERGIPPTGLVMMEWSAGKNYGDMKSGLAVMGQAQGSVRQWLRTYLDELPMTVEDIFWTNGVPKKERAAQVCMIFPEYKNNSSQDKGFDAADALGIALYYHDMRRVMKVFKGVENADKRHAVLERKAKAKRVQRISRATQSRK